MSGYLELQAVYFAFTGALTLGLWCAFARVPFLRARPRRRSVAVLGATALGAAVAVALIRSHYWLDSSQFGAVAIGFYQLAFWLPVAIACDAWLDRARTRPDRALLIGALLCTAGGLYALFIEPNRLQVTRNVLQFPQWRQGVACRIVHISDLQTVGACERERRAAEAINALEPDLIVWCGDYVAGPFDDPSPGIDAARSFLSSLRARYGIVCIPGHSEPERVRKRVLENLPVRYLENQVLELALEGGGVLRLLGAKALGQDFSALNDPPEPNEVTVVATHMPDPSRELDGRGVDLHLAGHTHGGQIALPFYGPPVTLSSLPRRFARGLHRFGDHWLHVTPGIGMEGSHAPRIRFLCPPSIDLIELRGGAEPLPEKTLDSSGPSNVQ